MIYNIYSLYDTASESYQFPNFSKTDESCIRDLVASITMHKDSLLYFQPDDFLLYAIGSFDNEKGTIEPCLPRLVARVGDIIKEGAKNE